MELTKKHVEVQGLTRWLMDGFDLREWVFRYNRRLVDLGNCFYPVFKRKKLVKPGRIELSYYFVKLNTNRVIFDVIMHEIAHALTPGHIHDEVWQAKAQSLGATPNRFCPKAITPPYAYRATCKNCWTVYYRHRQVKNVERGGKQYCVRCGPLVGLLEFRKRLV